MFLLEIPALVTTGGLDMSRGPVENMSSQTPQENCPFHGPAISFYIFHWSVMCFLGLRGVFCPVSLLFFLRSSPA